MSFRYNVNCGSQLNVGVCVLVHISITCLLWPHIILLDPKTNLIFLQLLSLQKQIFDAHAAAAIYLLHCI